MNYFYGALFAEVIFIIFSICKIIGTMKRMKKKRKKIDIILIIILVPLVSGIFYKVTLPKVMDIGHAINKELLVDEGTVEKTYITGGYNSFILDGKEYEYNPWKFKPAKGKRYKLSYLPNSKFVVDYEKK